MKICFIVDNYPSEYSVKGVFIRNLALALADMGFNINIICPRIFTFKDYKYSKEKYFCEDITANKNVVNVYRPWYIHFPLRKQLIKLTLFNYEKTILNTIKKGNIEFDILYSHFICPAGIVTSKIGKMFNKPSFLCVGESTRLIPNCVSGSKIYEYSLNKLNWKKSLDNFSGIICVSNFVKELLLKYNYFDEKQKLIVINNGINKDRFYKIDKIEARKKLKLPLDKFIIIFNGALDHNKGYLRLANVLNKINKQKEIYSIFISRGGNIKPINVKNQLFFGKCSNDELPLYLNASDLFVLPTLCEGCCNAIIEAIACGVPVISSNKSFNDGILDETNSIRINTETEEELENAILEFCSNKNYLKNNFNNNVLSINDRAERIINFINSCK